LRCNSWHTMHPKAKTEIIPPKTIRHIFGIRGFNLRAWSSKNV
jgi:hypothetical protein